MNKRTRMRIVVLAALVILASLVTIVWVVTDAKADGSPTEEPVATDPCFRQDIECYDQKQVECDNNVFVPLNLDGTWTCPGEQLPEEQIGRAVDCPDGSVGYVIDIQGTVRCPTDQVIPPGTRPGPDQVSPGDSHPFLTWSIIFEVLRFLLAYAK